MTVTSITALTFTTAGAGTSGGTTTNISEWTSVGVSFSYSGAGGASPTDTFKLQYFNTTSSTWVDVVGASTVTNGSNLGTINLSGIDLSQTAGLTAINGTSVAFRVIDVTGNVNGSGTTAANTGGTVTNAVLDVVAPTGTPSITSIADNVGTITTNLTNGGRTDDTTPTVTVSLVGTNAVAGNTVQLYNNGVALGAAVSLTATNITNTFVTITPTVTNGTTYVLTAAIIDAAANPGTASASFTTTIDTTPPTAPATVTYADDAGSITGNLANNGRTDDTVLTANISLAGTNAVAGDTVQVFNNTTAVSSVYTLTATDITNGTVALATSTLTNGTAYALNVKITDIAGNQSTGSTTVNTTVDTVAATPTLAVADNVGTIQGALTSGGFTDDTTPTLTFTLSGVLVNDTFQLYDNGVALGAPISLTSGQTTVTITPAALADGTTHVYTGKLTDVAGNVSAASTSFTITVDTTAPGVTVNDGSLSLSADTGSSSTDWVTATAAQTISGTLDSAFVAGDVLKYSLNNGTSWTAFTTQPAAGDTSFSSAGVTLSGSNTFQVAVFDAAGNFTTAATHSFVLDTAQAAPTISNATDDVGLIVGTLASGGSTDDTNLVINVSTTGLAVGDSIQLYSGTNTATPLGSAYVITQTDLTNGSVGLDTGALTAGAKTFTVRTTDLAGNASAASTSYTTTVDTTAPTGAITALTSISADTGTAGDWITSTAAQNVTYTKGTTVTGDVVKYSVDNGVTWTSFAPQPAFTAGTYTSNGVTLPAGSNTFKIAVFDAAGNNSAVLSHSFTLDTTAPTAPTLTVTDNAGNIVGLVASGGRADDTTPTVNVALAGTGAVAGDTIQLFNTTTALGTAYTITGADVLAGTAAITTTALTNGTTYSLNAVITDVAGNAGTASGNFSYRVDTTGPTASVVAAPTFSSDTGSSGTDRITNTASQTISGAISGTLTAGTDTVKYSLDNGVTWTNFTTQPAAANGTYSGTVTLVAGTNTLKVAVFDNGGNLATGATVINQAYTLDQTAPTAPGITSIADNVGSITANLTSGGRTDDTTPTVRVDLTGTGAAAGDTVALFNGASALGGGSVTLSAGDITAGFVDITLGTALTNGTTYNINAKITDVAGNASTASTNFTTTIDTTAAAAPTISGSALTDDVGSLQGTRATGSTTDDNLPVITVTLPVAGSLAVAGDTVQILDGATVVGSATYTSGATIAVAITSPLADGAHTLTARIVDVAGNNGTASGSFTVTVDTVNPTTVITAITTDSGTTGDHITSDTSLAISGTGETGSVVTLFQDGVSVGTATVAGGTWSITDANTLSDGTTYNFTASAVDVAGNAGALSAAYSATIDTTAPTAPTITAVADNVGSITGNLTSGGRTDDTTLSVTVSLSGTGAVAGDTVAVFNGATNLGSVTLSAGDITTGSVAITTSTLANGTTYTLVARVTDVAGNAGASSASFSTTVDTAAPTLPTITTVTDNVGSITGALTSGGRTDDNDLAVTVTVNTTGIVAGDTVQLLSGGTVVASAVYVSGTTVVLQTGALAEGAASLTARVVDIAGNIGASSTAFTTTVDTTAPNAPTLGTVTDNVGSITGAVTTGGSSDDTALTVAVTYASAVTGDTLQFYNNGVAFGSAIALTAATTSATVNIPTLTNGTTYVLTAKVIDVAGNASAASGSFTVTADTTAPIAPTVTYADDVGNITGNLSTGGRTDDTVLTANITLTGTNAVAGDKVQVFNTTTAVSAVYTLTQADIDAGTVALALNTQANGTALALNVKITDIAGNQSTGSTTVNTTIDTTAPTTPTLTVADNVGTIQGNLTSGGFTDDTSPTLNFTITAAVAGDTFQLFESGVAVGAPIALTVGQTTVSIPQTALNDGSTYVYTGKVTDLAGNVSTASSAFTITVDTTAPDEAVATLNNLSNDAGTSSTDWLTNAASQTISGTLDSPFLAGEILKYSVNNGTTWTAFTTQPAAGDTSFSSAGVTLVGSNTLQVAVFDAAGNFSTALTHAFTLDTTAPTGTYATSGTGITAGAGSLNGGDTVTIMLTGSEALTVTGTPTLTLNDGGVATYVSGSGTTTLVFSHTVAAGNTATDLQVTAVTGEIKDAAGNALATTTANPTGTLVVDTTAPNAPTITTVTDNVGSITGALTSGGATDDTTLAFTVTVSAVGVVAVGDTVQLLDGATVVGSAVYASGTTVSITTSALSEGAHTLTARVVDVAGNIGASSAAFTTTVDTTAPGVTVATLNNLSADTGSSSTDWVTATAAQTISGTLSSAFVAGDILKYSLNNGTSWTAFTTQPAAGDTSFSSAGVTLSGSNTFQVAVFDAAGNFTTAATHSFVLDTATPTLPTIAVGDDVGILTTNLANNSRTDDTDLAVTVTVTGTGIAAGDTVQLLSGGSVIASAVYASGSTVVLQTGTLAEGAYTLTARVVDLAGNVGASSTAITTTVDTTAPGVAVTTLNNLSADTGTAADWITTTAAQTLSGTLSAAFVAGDVLKYSANGGVTWTNLGTQPNAGATTYSGAATLVGGSNTLMIAVFDAAGNSSSAVTQPQHSYVLDTGNATTGYFSSLAIVAENGNAITAGTGAAKLGDVLTIAVNMTGPGTLSGTSSTLTLSNGATATYLSGSGTSQLLYTYTVGAGQTAADLTITTWTRGTDSWTPTATGTAISTNGGIRGSTSFFTTAYNPTGTFVIDVTAPTAPTFGTVTDNVGSITGTLAAAARTDDNDLTVNVTLGSSGAVAGDSIQLYNGATALGTAHVLTAGEITAGTVALQTGTLSDGSYTLTAKVTDIAGNIGTTTTGSLTITVDTVAPNAPSISVVDSVAPVTGTLTTGGQTNDTDLTVNVSLAGTNAVAGDKVQLFNGATALGSAHVITAGEITAGTVALQTGTLTNGTSYSFSAKVIDVAGNTSTASATLATTVDTSTPATPSVSVAAAQLNASEASNGESFTVTGENGSAMAVTFTGTGGTITISGTVSGPDFTATLNQAQLISLGQGAVSISAVSTDAAGNASAAGTGSFTLDTVVPDAPSITSIADNVGGSTGNIIAGATTDDAALTFSGTAEAGSTVTLYATNTLTSSTVVLGTATATGGSWSLTPGASQDDGIYTYHVTAMDAAGNVSSASAATAAITIDANIPGAPQVNIADTALNIAEVANGETFTVIADHGNTVTVTFVGTSSTLSDLATTEGPDGTFSVTLSQAQLLALGQGSVSLTASASDGFGAPSTHTDSFTIDTVAPAAPEVVVTLTQLNAAEAADGEDFTINAENGSAVSVTVIGTNGAGASITVSGTVSGPDFTAHFSEAQLLSLGQGEVTLTAYATDAAGNQSLAGTNTFILDTSIPTVPVITAVTDNVAPVIGALSDGAVSNDATLTLTGTADVDALVRIFDGATEIGTATVDGSGAWSFTTPTLSETTHSFTAKAEDSAGNISAPTSAFAVSVDTTAPATPNLASVTDDVSPVTGTLSSGDVSNDATLTLAGTAEANSTVTIMDGATTLTTVTADGLGGWSFTTSALSEASHSFTVSATDAASNVSNATSAFTVVVDVTAPVVAITTGGATVDMATQTLSGTVADAHAGSTVLIFDNGGETAIATATVNLDGSWSQSFSLGEGGHSLVAQNVDAAGNVGSSSSVSITYVVPTPSLTGAGGTVTDDDVGTIAPFSGVVITNAFATEQETVTVTLSDPTNGVLTNLGGGTYNPVTGVYTVVGSTSAVTAAVQGLAFTPKFGVTDSTTFNIVVHNQGATDATGSTTVEVTHNVVAEAPAFTIGSGDTFDAPLDITSLGMTSITLTDTGGTGELTGLGTTLTGFTTITVEAGASWTLTGDNSFADGQTIGGDGALTNTGIIYAGTADATATITVANFTNTGTIIVCNNDPLIINGNVVSDPLSLDNLIQVGGGGEVIFNGSVDAGQTLELTDHSGIVVLNDAANFAATIVNFYNGDLITLGGITDITGYSLEAGNVLLITTTAHGDVALNFADAEALNLLNFIFTTNGGNTDITIDRVAPAVPDFLEITTDSGVTDDAITNDTTLTFSGLGEVGSTVTLFQNGTEVGTAVVDAFNSWTITDSNTLTDGTTYIFTATASDDNGNTSAAGNLSVTIDTQVDRDTAASVSVNDSADHVLSYAETNAVEVTVGGVDADATATLVFTDAHSHTYSVAVTNGTNMVNLNGHGLDTSGTLTTALQLLDVAGNTGSVAGNSIDVVICFYPGTLVATPTGQRVVESLAIGDLVLTHEGAARPVRWMGRQTVSTVFADPLRVLPIRISAGALGAGMPERDLLVSPDHALLVEDILVQASALVGLPGITREEAVPERFTYHHVELADHSLILAEGVPAETFVDNVDRLAFDNWDEHEALYGHLPTIPEMDLPRAKSARQLPRALRDRLAGRKVA